MENNIFIYLFFRMYELKIFDTMEEMGTFLVAHNITDYNFKIFDFDFMGNSKKNIFLSFKY